MNRYFLGVDLGGTKSHALVADEHGQALGFAAAGPGNWESVGWDGTRAVLEAIIQGALSQAGLSKRDVTGAGFGIAGLDFPEDRAPHAAIIDGLRLDAPYIMGNDTLVALAAGAAHCWGVVVTAGTSNNCLGRDRSGREARALGQGSQFGEYGGAVEIVQRGVQAVALAWTARGPETALTDAFMAHVGATDPLDLLAGLVRERYELDSGDAPIVFAQAAAGDEVAQGIIDWAGRELGSLACGVIRRLNLEAETFDLVLAGSLYNGSPRLTTALTRTVHELAPGARPVRLDGPPVIGGALLGMEAAGVMQGDARARLLETTSRVLA
jgi:N-acetylglucosamine kinase-like BadF-type ATPase